MSVHEDFHADARPLVVGSITGTRSFAVDGLGRLTGVSYSKVWTPGLNTATCTHSDAAIKREAERMAEPEPEPTDPAKSEARGEEWSEFDVAYASYRRALTRTFSWHILGGGGGLDKPHKPGAKGCECGFWAYFDGSDDFSDRRRVTAVVNGQGVVTVGSKGFRAEQAEIVALVDPTRKSIPSRWHRWQDWLDKYTLVAALATVVGTLATLMGVAFVITSLVAGEAGTAVVAGLLSLLAAGAAASGWANLGHYCSLDHGAGDEIPWDAVRRAYPDVPVYPSLKAALRVHPLTPPPAPEPPEPITPDNTPDFWERKA